jgi:hypothetical protein
VNKAAGFNSENFAFETNPKNKLLSTGTHTPLIAGLDGQFLK